MSITSGGYGQCVTRSLLLGMLAAKVGAPLKEIYVFDRDHPGLYQPGIIRTDGPVRRPVHVVHVDEYEPPTLGDLLADKKMR